MMIRPFSQLVVLTSLFQRPTYGCDAATRSSLSGGESASCDTTESAAGKSTNLHPAKRKADFTNPTRKRGASHTSPTRQRGSPSPVGPLKLTTREPNGSER